MHVGPQPPYSDGRATRTVARVQKPSRLAGRRHWVIHFTDGVSTEWDRTWVPLSVYPTGSEPQPWAPRPGPQETRDAY